MGVKPIRLGRKSFRKADNLQIVQALETAAIINLDCLLSFLTKAAQNAWEFPSSLVQSEVGAIRQVIFFSRNELSITAGQKV